jgi:hypothetical protein
MSHGDERKGRGSTSKFMPDLPQEGILPQWQQGTTGHPYEPNTRHLAGSITMNAISPVSKGVVQRRAYRFHRRASEVIQQAS